MKRSESDRSEEGMILGSSDATFVLLRSGFYICAQETVGKVEMVLASKWRQEQSEYQFIMIDIFLVERKKIYIGRISCSVEFSVLVGSTSNSLGWSCGLYICKKKRHNDVNEVKYHHTQNSSPHSLTIITLMISVSFDHPFSLNENRRFLGLPQGT